MDFAQGKRDELIKKVLYTALGLIVYRVVAQFPVPGVDGAALNSYFNATKGGFFDLFNTFTGGSFKRFSVLALGIMPYITTSIVFSLLAEVIPQLAELQEDSDGHRKIQKWTRYFTVILCAVQGYGMTVFFESVRSQGNIPVVPEPGMLFRFTAVVTLVAGTMFLLWLGERITEYGLENGVSLIIFAGIAVDLPSEVIQKATLYRQGELSGFSLLMFAAIMIGVLYFVAFVERAYRNIPVQYAKRIINNRVYGGNQVLPMRVDTGGVMPPILASSLLAAPATMATFIGGASGVGTFLDHLRSALMPGTVTFNLMYAGLIAYMAFFYAPIQFKTKKISDNLQKNNAFIPGIRPGSKTQEFLDFVLNKLTFVTAIFLIIVCVGPSSSAKYADTVTRFGGTAMLILVSVSIRVMMNVQSFLYADRYESAYKVKGKHSGSKRRF